MNKKAWIEGALSQGFESFEIFEQEDMDASLSWYEGEMESYSLSQVKGVALRGVYEGRMASIAFEKDKDDMMQDILETMKQQAMAIDASEVGIVRAPMETASLAPKAAESVSNDTAKALLGELEKKILAADKRIVQVNSLEYCDGETSRHIVNSKGIDLAGVTRMRYIVGGAAARQGDEVKNAHYVALVNDLAAFDADGFAASLADKATGKLQASSVPSDTYPLVMEKEAMTSLLAAFSTIYSGERFQKGISPLHGKIGEKVFSDKITVIDDPQEPLAQIRMAFDDEGCPTQRKILVDHGVLRTVLHNSSTAAKMDTVSTGNGFKASYGAPVEVMPMNLSIENGNASFDDLLKEMGDGLVITELAGLHAGIDHLTADFSLQCEGYRVENGKKTHSVSLITIAANFIDMMNHAKAIGNDRDFSYRRFAAPSILFEGCAISGK